jgi:hypothetical protein
MPDASELQLAAEMAVISTAKSTELVELAGSTDRLQRMQEELDDRKDNVEIVKRILTATQPHQLDVAEAERIDQRLERAEVEIPAVSEAEGVLGAECLGRSLMVNDFFTTRLMGCENFLANFYQQARQITQLIGANFKEVYLVLTESVDSLEHQVELLEKQIQAAPNFKAGTDRIALGVRLYNLLKVNGKINEDWVSNISKLHSSIQGLSTNYYLNSKNNLNATLSYFGGFAGLDDAAGKERLLLLPKAIPSTRFKECTYPNRDNTTNTVLAKQSVELMGGAYFVDTRREKVNLEPKTVEQVEGYIQGYVDFDATGFENKSVVEYPKIGTDVATLSAESIRVICKQLRDIIKNWRKAFEGDSRYKLEDADYNDIVKGIYESDMSEEMKSRVRDAFSTIVRKNQLELLAIRAAVNNYLVLIFNGIIELANTSIRANEP